MVLTLSALVLSWGVAFGQAPPAAPATPNTDQQLDAYLQRWEQEMGKIQTLYAQLNRIDKDTTFNVTQKFSGVAQYMKVGGGGAGRAVNLATLEMRPEGKPEISEKLIITATHLYIFSPAKKEINAHQVTPPKEGGQANDDNLLTMLFGIKAQEARRRYDLRLVSEDKYYIYINVTPRNQQDKVDFTRARLVLNRDTFLPRQLWLEEANGSEHTWDIPGISTNKQLNRNDFDAPTAPPGWKLIPVQRTPDTQPRLYRGNQ
jgi:TIGR03009 family protein